MMDNFIIINTLISMIVYFILHIIILRKINQKDIFKWLAYVYFIASFTPFLIGWWMGWQMIPEISLSSIIIGVLVAWIFYTFLVLAYVLAILGIMESSVRIRLLKEIYNVKDTGITLKQILIKYNKDVILQKRLRRFIAVGEISFKGGKYQLEKRFTAYSLPNLVIKSIWKLYGGVKL